MKSANISPENQNGLEQHFVKHLFKDYGYNFDTIKKNGGVVHMVSYKGISCLMKDKIQADVFMAATSVPQAKLHRARRTALVLGLLACLKKGSIELSKTTLVIFMEKYQQVHTNLLIKDIPTLGIVTSAIVNKDLSDDLVYKMTKVFWENHAEFVKVKSIWKKSFLKKL